MALVTKRGAEEPLLGRRQVVATFAAFTSAVLASRVSPATAQPVGEVTHSAEAIHQERRFKASRQRVYDALAVSAQFDRIIQLSGVMQSPYMARMQSATQIGQEEGSAFTLFGGYIVGRQVELLPTERIVQAWRVSNWPRGVYSMARFELIADGTGTKISFDHTGFPSGEGEHLAAGWQEHYWTPLERFLS
jgi:activator of HSP90 ATPase